jgi:ubiquinol-cytochrome c reductase cytochrome c subunit
LECRARWVAAFSLADGRGEVRGRVVAFGALAAAGSAVVCFAILGRPGPSGAVATAQSGSEVRHVFLRDCAFCHGADARGTELGPDLRGAGAAQVDFQLATGRMPVPLGDASRTKLLGSVGDAQDRRPPKYDAPTRRALVRYVTQLAGGDGPAIPTLDVRSGDVARGGSLFRLQCAACHAWSGDGGALLDREAPGTHAATALEIAEAVRSGPGNMPAFGRAALSDDQLQSLVRYVRYLDDPEDRGGSALWHLGPLAEGAVAILVGLGLLVVAVRWIGTRT